MPRREMRHGALISDGMRININDIDKYTEEQEEDRKIKPRPRKVKHPEYGN